MTDERLTEYFTSRKYRDKLRILLILYFFSSKVEKEEELNAGYNRVFKSEVRIQKIDFLIRYPDYLSFELLLLLENPDFHENRTEIKQIVRNIFNTQEPELRRNDMLRYFFGAYEDIDDIIAFFVSNGFVVYRSSKNVDGRVVDKIYYLTNLAITRIENEILISLEKARWYKDRCQLIKKFFGNLSGSELKIRQYQYEEYRNTPINEYIKGIKNKVKDMFLDTFEEEL
ncbi:hypothetical protein P5G62_010050 [Neobacillus sp. 179-C4.2 HS]|uniref:Uncharacterized protein n=1 Tax=Neobacillus driksii TaxID=3035913 RepID=A0ABV4YRF7_9BACI|nr:hypothetical protein [Neobacillus sp. 179.-C4.2 HS]MDP5195022.1 hypothetical protein [Neobacillus sp. 179.-C4.2 HS]